MPLDQHDLIFCVGMAPHVPLFDRLMAAREAGYAAVSVLSHEYDLLRESGMRDTEMRQRFADEGMAIGELDGLAVWLPGQAPPPRFPKDLGRQLMKATPEAFVPVAAAMGARSITAIEFFGVEVEVDRAVEAFAEVCDLAANEGVLVHLEFLPWAGIPDLRMAWEIVRQADRSNGGLLVDSWHLFRSGSTLEDLRSIPGDKVLGVQLGDAPKTPETDLAEETQHRRLIPGAGNFDLTGLVRTLDEIGSRAPMGVEVLSDDLSQQPVDAIASSTFEATTQLLQSARG
jgi:sugar phosphate isomerase/epimerase